MAKHTIVLSDEDENALNWFLSQQGSDLDKDAILSELLAKGPIASYARAMREASLAVAGEVFDKADPETLGAIKHLIDNTTPEQLKTIVVEAVSQLPTSPPVDISPESEPSTDVVLDTNSESGAKKVK